MSKKTKTPETAPHGRAREHLKKILQTTALTGAAFTLGTACESCHPMVCDPMPSPMCKSSSATTAYVSAGRLQTQASWQQTDAGALFVRVEINLYGQGETMTFKADPALSGATISEVVRTDNKVSFALTPNAGVTQVQAILEVDCATIPRGFKLGFDVTAPAAGAAVTVTGLD
jgi:hypothetical protein